MTKTRQIEYKKYCWKINDFPVAICQSWNILHIGRFVLSFFKQLRSLCIYQRLQTERYDQSAIKLYQKHKSVMLSWKELLNHGIVHCSLGSKHFNDTFTLKLKLPVKALQDKSRSFSLNIGQSITSLTCLLVFKF